MGDLTKPCCEDCWVRKNPGRMPYRLREDYREQEQCVYCQRLTLAGIYVG